MFSYALQDTPHDASYLSVQYCTRIYPSWLFSRSIYSYGDTVLRMRLLPGCISTSLTSLASLHRRGLLLQICTTHKLATFTHYWTCLVSPGGTTTVISCDLRSSRLLRAFVPLWQHTSGRPLRRGQGLLKANSRFYYAATQRRVSCDGIMPGPVCMRADCPRGTSHRRPSTRMHAGMSGIRVVGWLITRGKCAAYVAESGCECQQY